MSNDASRSDDQWPYDGAMVGRRPSTRRDLEFGKRLAAARRRKGLTQTELALLLGVSQSLVGHYETRATNPQLSFFEKAAEVLDTTVAELIGEQRGDPPSPTKRGPKSQLDVAVELARQLPRHKQQVVAQLIEAYVRAGG